MGRTMTDERPDPDVLLARVQRDEARHGHGRLKIFLGAAAGVGKTYAMLSALREKRAGGTDAIVGVTETHGRSDTAALLDGLEALALRSIVYRGVQVREFDLDAALARRPQLIAMDELAHTNATGSRHRKRWNDVQELLDAGIDVYTTLNVQHLESLNDVVGGITGVRVSETVPDSIFDAADEVELVDLPPDELLTRLHEGKVYVPAQAQHAVDNFFRKGNLIALRELALRRTAERVDAQMRDYRDGHAIRDVWPSGERVLVCIGSGPTSERLVRAGRRLAVTLHAEWIVAYVETPALQRLSPQRRDAVMASLRLAEELGATTVTLSGPDMSAEILALARAQNVTRIMLGKPRRSGWRRWLLGSVVDTIVRQAHGIDVHLLSAEPRAQSAIPETYFDRSRLYLGIRPERRRITAQQRRAYLWSIAVTAACTLVATVMAGHFDLSNVVMIYLLGVVYVAARHGRGPALLASVLSVVAFDLFLVPPYFNFAVSDTQFLITFGVMLVVALVISGLTANVRSQAKVASHRERRTRVLYDLSRELAAARTEQDIVKAVVRHIGGEFEGQSAVLFPDSAGKISYPTEDGIQYSFHGADLGVAQWVFDHTRVAGNGTDTLPGADGVYLPLIGSSEKIGVLALLPVNLRRVFLPEQQRLLDTFMTQAVQAIERVRLAEQARVAQVAAETERLRNSLLSAISHDLRTPLATIVGASSSLVEESGHLDPKARRELSHSIYDEARRMTRLANNILDMARLDAGAVKLNLQWYPVEEIIGGVLTRLQLDRHLVNVSLPENLPMALLDAVLIEQVLENLLDNAVKYAAAPIDISARVQENVMIITVADRGPGVPKGNEKRLFEKFERANMEGVHGGAGLGLTICRAIVVAHGGRIWAEQRADGGAAFHFTLPLEKTPPAIEPEYDPDAAAA
jgi:two-component system sensor histidine kinase KdpD